MFQGYEEPFGRDAIENIVRIGQLESQIPICLFWTLSRHFARRDGGGLALVGLGAFSIDAWLFGWKRINFDK
jgi:hypothetical protein